MHRACPRYTHAFSADIIQLHLFMLDRPRNLFLLYQVPGHASSIAKVRFTSDNKYLIVLGRFNRTITQYSIQKIDKEK
tara:strand:- start:687 stop:920 length:234 start_codon:yes stop_codon:yes gene_type:complete